MRYMKKMMCVRQATTNSFMYLELGILPVRYEIHKRQISFLHHILNLRDDDPVKIVRRTLAKLPEYNNWWCGVRKLMERYSIQLEETEIKEMSKDLFKKKVKVAIRNQAFEDLKKECGSKKKTENIQYTTFETQDYIKLLYPNIARTIFKCRAKTLNIKSHTKFKFKDSLCRWCGVTDETLEHIVNCGRDDEMIVDVEKVLHELKLEEVGRVASRVNEFLDKVDI